MNKANHALPAGTVLQGRVYNYTIQKVLGQGAFGITYLAFFKVPGPLGEVKAQAAVKEFFAKELDARLEDGTVVPRTEDGIVHKYAKAFQRESENLSKIKHPGIVNVLEAFEANGTCYYSMEYLSGGSLDDKIKGVGLPESEALALTEKIGEALSFMHSRKMMHLDLKPKNIMLMDDGTPVIIDFGLSKQFGEDGEPESSSTIGLGTPGYAPIEQATQTASGEFQPTVDVYALGATLYKMLTGSTPPAATLILNKKASLLPTLQTKGVSDSTARAVSRAMSPLMDDRPQSVKEFLSMLFPPDPVIAAYDEEDETEMKKGTPENPAPQSNPTPEQPAKPRKNWLKPLLACLTALVAIVAAVLGVKKCNHTEDRPVIPVVTVQDLGDGSYAYHIDGDEKPLTIEEAEQILIDLLSNEKDPSITILADPDLPYGAVEPLLFLAERNHFRLSPDSTLPEKQSEPEPEAPGSIKISSDPAGAVIWLDGKNTRKKTPSTLEDIVKGNHTVRLVLDGYEEGSRTIQVLPSSESAVSMSLTPKTPEADTKGDAEFQTSNDVGDNFLLLTWPTEFKSVSSEQVTTLNRYVNWLKEHPDVRILVCGYSTKKVGTPAINLQLAEECATAVKELILKRGISESRIVLDYRGGVDHLFPGKEYRNAVICTTIMELEEPVATSGGNAAEMRQVNIFFDKESTDIATTQTAKLNSYADWLKANPNVNISIAGYSGRSTSNASQNMRIADGRAAAVKEYLLKRGVAESRIVSVVGNGDRIQPFEDDELNNVVICTTK